ncbi:hypothetical protein QCE62_05625 [Caballeronia sp. LZ033]|uniref:hypothetical protein n=1 Tax=Caballeronia sp. LZ033 TaxID=3038566 RepID=UPI00285F8321|nr:hypothetical protein [Caballeronia sp. LZ033]MDR5813069.1 hypothetical protein [Caballeronia sp. LZ033]
MRTPEEAKAYYQLNRERILEQRARRYRENIEAEKKYYADYYQKNKQRILEKARLKRGALANVV